MSLPYRLRPPTFCDKEHKERKKGNEDFSGGGPVQRCMEQDLLELLPTFIERLDTSNKNCCTAEKAFGAFRHVFGQAKVALVHTRTIPPRSDRDAYSQLLYASCLSILKQEFQKETLCLKNVAFSLFCLYALYETNPLPTEAESPLQMLSMGLQCPENPRVLYRRTFRQPIRMDRHHYSLLQRARDEALACQADCQSARMQQQEAHVCLCSVAVDIVHVVDRLGHCLDYSEYTGPRGLEALAGHADYPYSCIRPKKKTSNAEQRPAMKTIMSNDELDQVAKREVVSEPVESLTARIDQYKEHLAKICLVPGTSNQATRVKNALEQIFARQESWKEISQEISSRGKSDDTMQSSIGPSSGRSQALQPDLDPDASTRATKTVTWSTTKDAPMQGIDEEQNEAASESLKNDNGITEQDRDVSFRLVFPSDLSEAAREGIQEALMEMVQSGESIVDSKSAMGKDEVSINEEVSTLGHSHFDDSSVAGLGSASVNSAATGQGRAALRALLSAATTDNDAASGAKTAARRRRPTTRVRMDDGNSVFGGGSISVQSAASDQGKASLQELLSAVSTGNDGAPTAKNTARRQGATASMGGNHMDDWKSSIEIGDASVLSAATGQGQAALRALLSTAVAEPTLPDNPPVAIVQRGLEASRRPLGDAFLTMNSDLQDSMMESDHSDISSVSSDDDDSSVVSTAVGRNALRELLSSVEGGDSTKKKRKRASSGTKRPRRSADGPKRPRTGSKRSARSTDEHDGNDEFSLPSMHGRAALNALLSQVSASQGETQYEEQRAWV